MSSNDAAGNREINNSSNEPLIYPANGTLRESPDGEPKEFAEVKELRRGLAQRHIQMIALAGTIGTGLFLGSGKAIARAGPLGAFALVPLSGGIIRHAEYFVDPALSFANGWNQVYSNIITIPAELVAAAVLIQFWVQINNAVWIICFGFLLVISNLLFVRALVITCGGGPNGETYGFRYWRNPGPFVDYLGYTGALGHFMGFWTTFSNAVYAYSGVENFSLAAAETQSPRRNIPIAAKRIFFRVMLFYVLSIFMIGMIVPSNDKELLWSTGTAAQSPFVIAANNAGIKVVPSIINAVVLTSAWSAGNAAMLGGSRMLYGLGQHGHSPKVFLQTNRFDVPYIAIGFLSLFICLGFLTLSSSASVVFNWLQDFVAVAALVNWMIICGVYLRFYYGCRKQGISRSTLPWKGPFQPYAAWIALISFSLLLLTGGYSVFIKDHWDTETFVSSYINIPLILILYFGYKYKKGTVIIPLTDIPIQKFIDIANDNPEPEDDKVVGWKRLNILWS
ncbi:putative amino acid protein [Botrytis cinerea BcDW1]|uniref:Putative amino acid protein n=1 Tax=Botryotinia fuckeliana (strain BcDW1) TaxID=1290391 RepID=M7UJR3_BOTF1|nr:putative amino acid protein [Botrytis cinerea BcDW1]